MCSRKTYLSFKGEVSFIPKVMFEDVQIPTPYMLKFCKKKIKI